MVEWIEGALMICGGLYIGSNLTEWCIWLVSKCRSIKASPDFAGAALDEQAILDERLLAMHDGGALPRRFDTAALAALNNAGLVSIRVTITPKGAARIKELA